MKKSIKIKKHDNYRVAYVGIVADRDEYDYSYSQMVEDLPEGKMPPMEIFAMMSESIGAIRRLEISEAGRVFMVLNKWGLIEINDTFFEGNLVEAVSDTIKGHSASIANREEKSPWSINLIGRFHGWTLFRTKTPTGTCAFVYTAPGAYGGALEDGLSRAVDGISYSVHCEMTSTS